MKPAYFPKYVDILWKVSGHTFPEHLSGIDVYAQKEAAGIRINMQKIRISSINSISILHNYTLNIAVYSYYI